MWLQRSRSSKTEVPQGSNVGTAVVVTSRPFPSRPPLLRASRALWRLEFRGFQVGEILVATQIPPALRVQSNEACKLMHNLRENGTLAKFLFPSWRLNLVTSQSTAEAPSCFFQKRVFLACHPDITSLPSSILSVVSPTFRSEASKPSSCISCAGGAPASHSDLQGNFSLQKNGKKKNTTNFLTRFFFSNKFDQ